MMSGCISDIFSRSLCFPPALIHFWIVTKFFSLGNSLPVKKFLNCTIPELVNSKDGSSRGIKGDEGYST